MVPKAESSLRMTWVDGLKTELSSSGIVKLAWLTLLMLLVGIRWCDANPVVPPVPPCVQIEVERILDEGDVDPDAIETQWAILPIFKKKNELEKFQTPTPWAKFAKEKKTIKYFFEIFYLKPFR